MVTYYAGKNIPHKCGGCRRQTRVKMSRVGGYYDDVADVYSSAGHNAHDSCTQEYK